MHIASVTGCFVTAHTSLTEANGLLGQRRPAGPRVERERRTLANVEDTSYGARSRHSSAAQLRRWSRIVRRSRREQHSRTEEKHREERHNSKQSIAARRSKTTRTSLEKKRGKASGCCVEERVSSTEQNLSAVQWASDQCSSVPEGISACHSGLERRESSVRWRLLWF